MDATIRANDETIRRDTQAIEDAYTALRQYGNSFLQEAQNLSQYWQGTAGSLNYNTNTEAAGTFSELLEGLGVLVLKGQDIANNYNIVESVITDYSAQKLDKSFLD